MSAIGSPFPPGGSFKSELVDELPYGDDIKAGRLYVLPNCSGWIVVLNPDFEDENGDEVDGQFKYKLIPVNDVLFVAEFPAADDATHGITYVSTTTWQSQTVVRALRPHGELYTAAEWNSDLWEHIGSVNFTGTYGPNKVIFREISAGNFRIRFTDADANLTGGNRTLQQVVDYFAARGLTWYTSASANLGSAIIQGIQDGIFTEDGGIKDELNADVAAHPITDSPWVYMDYSGSPGNEARIITYAPLYDHEWEVLGPVRIVDDVDHQGSGGVSNGGLLLADAISEVVYFSRADGSSWRKSHRIITPEVFEGYDTAELELRRVHQDAQPQHLYRHSEHSGRRERHGLPRGLSSVR